MRLSAVCLGFVVVCLFVGCNNLSSPEHSTDTVSPNAVAEPPTTRCQVNARGTLETGERFAGYAFGNSSCAVGRWTLLAPDKKMFTGQPDLLVCEQNGALLITIQGTGSFDGQSGLLFQLVMQDRQDPALSDTFRIVIKTPADDLVYEAAGLFTTGDIRSVQSF